MGTVLHDSVLGEGPDVVLLHGLFGQGTNLGGIARGLQGAYRVHSLDLPDHGRSGWTAAPSIPGYAEAVSDWMAARSISRAHFVGHSLGGKVAMALALACPTLVDRLVVADIAPVAYQPSHGNILAGLAAVSAAGCASRGDADAVLQAHVEAPGVRQFLLMSLMRTEHNRAMDWRLNREGLTQGYPRLLEALEESTPFDGECLFIRGAHSDYVKEGDMTVVARLFPHYRLVALANSGHWLHMDEPAQFNAQLLAFLT